MKIYQFILSLLFLSFSQFTYPKTSIPYTSKIDLATTTEITNVSPAINTITAPPNSNIILSFVGTIDPALVNSNTIVIRGDQTGIIPGIFSGGGTNTITFDPTTDFAPGEIITVTITDAVATSFTYQFTVRVSAALGTNSISNVQQTITTNAVDANRLYAADLNNDGDIDILSASGGDNRIAWYENTSGGFGSPATNQNTITTNASNAFSTVSADIDGDGDLDVLSASSSDDRIAWYENLGNGNFGDPATNQNTISTLADGALSIHAADLDNDGHIDVIANSNSDVVWYRNLGNGDFGNPLTNQRFIHDSPTFTLVSSVYAADFNNDGHLDVVSGSFIGNTIAWYQNLGNGDFGDPTTNQNTVFTTVNGGITSVYAADMDNDGAIDILSSSRNDNRIVSYRNFNNGNFGTFTNISTVAIGAESVYAADMDGDGDLDALSASSVDNRIAWYENIINGFFGDPATNQITISTAANGARDVYAVDVDNDGDLDVLSASRGDNRIAWYENPSTPTIPVFLAVSSATGNEADATVITMIATADSPVSGDQTVDLGVSGTNITTGDFILSSTSITIADGQTVGTATFTIVDDAIFEGEETATLTISNPSLQLVIDGPTQNITIIDNEIGETEVTLDSSGNLSITDSNGGNSDDTITLTLVNDDTELNIHNTVDNISPIGPDVAFVDINNVRVPLAAITGDITINTFEGIDTITLDAELNLVANQNLTILGASTITQNSNLSYSDGTIFYQATDVITVNAASWTSSESGNTTLLSEGDININGNIQHDAATLGGTINLVAGWDGVTPFDPTVFDGFDTGDELAGITPFGNNNGSVRIGDGTQTEAIRVGSRSGANRVYGYDLAILRNQSNSSNRFVQLGVGGAGSNLDVTSSISVRVRHDIELVQAHIGHGGTVNDAPIDIAAGNNLNFSNPGISFSTTCRLGHLVDDNGSNETASGNITIFHANDVLLTRSNIGHGGFDFEGTLSGDITIHKAHDLILNGFSQLGHGGFRQDRTDNMGNITLMDVNDISLTGQSNFVGQGPRIGHGGLEADSENMGDIHIVKANDINLTGGGALLAIAQIGHGTIDDFESFPDGRNRTGNHSGDILIDEVQNITLTGGSGEMAFTQIGHGGANFNRPTQQSIGFLNGIVTVNATGEISLIDGNNAVTNGNFAWLGHASAAHTDGLDGTQADVGNPFDFFTTDNGDENITITARAMDNAVAVVPSGGVGTVRGDWMQYSMRGGNVVLNITDAGLVTTGGDVDLDGFITGLQTLPADATHGLTIMTAYDLTVNHAIQSQNPNTGNSLPINLIAGWDGNTPFDAATFDAVNVNAGSPTLFGNNEGSVSIGDGSQAFGVTIGSQSAATRVYGQDLNITGGTGNGIFAQLGFHISNAGSDFMITGPLTASLRNDITIIGGNGTDAYALLGHVGTDQDDDNMLEAMVNAPITINAGNNLDMSANGVVAYGQLGHGGADALGDFIGDITITTVNDINLVSDNSILAYTQLGHGGANANGNHSGNITISTANDLTITSGDAISSYSQLGHGGLNANGNLSGTILLQDVNDLSFQGGTALNSYSQLGHGSATFGSNVQSSGIREGVITILGSGELSVIDGNTPETNANYGWIGHGSIDTAADTYANAGLALTIDRLDNSTSALTPGDQGNLRTDWLLNNLRGGGVILNVADAGLNLNPSTAILGTLSSSSQLLVQVNNDLVFNNSLALNNTGTGNMVFVAGENFHNDSGSTTPINTGGRWLIYSTNSSLNRQDTEIDNFDFQQYDTFFNPLDPIPSALPSGNGLIYSDGETLGIDDLTDLSSMSVYPNPVINYITLHNPNNININSIRLLDITGKSIQQFNVNEDITNQRFNLSGLQASLYLLEINANNTKLILKIIKQ